MHWSHEQIASASRILRPQSSSPSFDGSLSPSGMKSPFVSGPRGSTLSRYVLQLAESVKKGLPALTLQFVPSVPQLPVAAGGGGKSSPQASTLARIAPPNPTSKMVFDSARSFPFISIPFLRFPGGSDPAD